MTLEELARAAPQARPLAVPAWTLGCFHRRCITYANGREDTSTTVVWIQSHGLTGDIRVPAWRPSAAGKAGFADFSPEEIALLASVEGGVADTSFADGRMHWNNWAAFQPYDKWPEPGLLQRIGPCLVEWAPSGIYVEDWRLQPGSSGLLAGLRLVSETGPDGVERPRDGGLVISGDHALFALGRYRDLPQGRPAQAQLAQDPALLDTVFEAEASYAVRAGEDYRIALSTDPFREGEDAPVRHGFEPAGDGLLRQAAGGIVRHWRVDTLLADVDIPAATPAAEAGAAWLAGEAATLLR